MKGVILFLLMSASAAMAQFPTSGLVAYYKLDESTGATRNDSVSSNHLTDHNTVVSGTGKIGNAATFVLASSQYLSHADATAFQMGTGSFTLAAWVKFTGTSEDIVWYGNTSGGWGFSENSGSIRAIISDGPHAVGTGVWNTYNNNAWRLVVVTFDRAANMLVYVDNVHDSHEFADITTVTGSVNSATGFVIGGYNGGPAFNGSVDEVGLWNRVLTGSEITALWNGGAGVTYSGSATPTPGASNRFFLSPQ